MLSASQQRFVDAYVADPERNAAKAYRVAYPKITAKAAESCSSRLLKTAKVQAELRRIRAEAEKMAGGAVLTLAEKRSFVARLLRAKVGLLDHESDLWNSIKYTESGREYRLPDKLKAIEIDNDLAGEGSEAESQDVLKELLERVMK